MDLTTANSWLNCHHCSIDDQEKTIRSLHECQEQLKEKIDSLMRVVDHLRIEIGVCNETIVVLKEKITEMKNCLCHCVGQGKGKGKGKEVVQVEEPLVFNYDSDDIYCMAPSTGGVKVLELISIDSNLFLLAERYAMQLNLQCSRSPIIALGPKYRGMRSSEPLHVLMPLKQIPTLNSSTATSMEINGSFVPNIPPGAALSEINPL